MAYFHILWTVWSSQTAKQTNKTLSEGCIQRAVSRKRGCIPADSFVRIWKFVACPNLCETPACVKPPPRCMQAGDSAMGRSEKQRMNVKKANKSEKRCNFATFKNLV